MPQRQIFSHYLMGEYTVADASLEALERRRNQVQAEITRLVEDAITNAIAGKSIVRSASIVVLTQDFNIITAAMERIRNAE